MRRENPLAESRYPNPVAVAVGRVPLAVYKCLSVVQHEKSHVFVDVPKKARHQVRIFLNLHQLRGARKARRAVPNPDARIPNPVAVGRVPLAVYKCLSMATHESPRVFVDVPIKRLSSSTNFPEYALNTRRPKGPQGRPESRYPNPVTVAVAVGREGGR